MYLNAQTFPYSMGIQCLFPFASAYTFLPSVFLFQLFQFSVCTCCAYYFSDDAIYSIWKFELRPNAFIIAPHI